MMIKLNTLTLTIFFAVGISIAAAQDYAVTKDLQREWKVFQNGAYEPFQKVGSARSVFFSVEVAKVMRWLPVHRKFCAIILFSSMASWQKAARGHCD